MAEASNKLNILYCWATTCKLIDRQIGDVVILEDNSNNNVNNYNLKFYGKVTTRKACVHIVKQMYFNELKRSAIKY